MMIAAGPEIVPVRCVLYPPRVTSCYVTHMASAMFRGWLFRCCVDRTKLVVGTLLTFLLFAL